jgi:hypothetical protein
MKYNPRVVPDDPDLNAKWRKKTLELCAEAGDESEMLRRALMERCRKDFWFFAKGFCFLHETRILDDDAELTELNTQTPFLPWPHQVPVVNRILQVLGKQDLRIVKSRAQGASWILVLIFIWMWLFHKGFKGNLVSKDEAAVDRKRDMDALLTKCDWLLDKLPTFLVGVRGVHWFRSWEHHTFARADGETTIAGYACTQDVASGGRCMVFGVDEHAKHPRPQDRDAMASTQPISRCRIFISTPKGQDGEFYRLIHDSTIDGPVLYLDWRENPTQNRGLYRITKGFPVAVDVDKYGPLPDKYNDGWLRLRSRLEERGYDLTSGERSPWYDTECLRAGASPMLVAQEYDMHFGASEARYFAEALVNRLLNQVSSMPLRGEFQVDPESLRGYWTDNPDGRLRLWVELDNFSRPPMGEYIVASDVSAGRGGSGSSNSTITVLNRRTGRKVASFATPTIDRHTLAELCIALCYWFANYRGDPGFLIWEDNGYGADVRDRVERSGFQNYYRRKARDAHLHSRHSDKGGYWTVKRSRLLGPYMESLVEGYFDNQDRQAIDELRQYQLGTDGEPYHVGEKDKTDPSGAGAAHGDRVVADALAWHASVDFGDYMESRNHSKPNVLNARDGDVPRESFAWRRAKYLEMRRKQQQKSNW